MSNHVDAAEVDNLLETCENYSTMKLSQEQQLFIERYAAFAVKTGTPPSMARVIGLLLVCQPSYQSAADIQKALGLSAGGVSNATSLLTRAQLIEQKKIPGERKLYYELRPDGFIRNMQQRLAMASEGKHVAEQGLQMDTDNERLRSMHSAYSVLEYATEDLKKYLASISKTNNP